MLWMETHRPRSFDEIPSHRELVDTLSAYTLDTLPNLTLHGHDGHNKKTLMYAFINHLYGQYPVPARKTIELKVASETLQVNYVESEEMIEISPSDYGTRDRQVVQHIIKIMAENRPIMSLFGDKKHRIKILVIDRAEELSRDAQAALRMTMEMYSGHFRMFMLCTEVSKLIEPIRSRSLFVRVRGFEKRELKEICEKVLEKEGFTVDGEVLDGIVENAAGNCKRAMCVLELYCFNRDENEYKKQKRDMRGFRLEWEEKLDEIAETVMKQPRVDRFPLVRRELYGLLGSGVPAVEILVGLARRLAGGHVGVADGVAKQALVYEQRMRLGSKELFHLEAFIAGAMVLYANKRAA